MVCQHVLLPHGLQILVSSNDSRLRLYDISEYRQCCKYKGHANRQAQIKATFSRDGKYIICGSDTGHVFVWSTSNPVIPPANPSYAGFRKVRGHPLRMCIILAPRCLSPLFLSPCRMKTDNALSIWQDKNSSYEAFPAHDDMVTVALFAPEPVPRFVHRDGETDVVPASHAASDLLQSTLGSASGSDALPEAKGSPTEEETEAAGPHYPEHTLREVILGACSSGAIKVFESRGELAGVASARN